MAYGAILGQTPTVDAYTKEQTLTAATAALYGLGSDAVPNDVLNKIDSLFDSVDSQLSNLETDVANGPKIVTGSYVGTGTYDANNPNSLTFDFAPKFVMLTLIVNISEDMWYTSSGAYSELGIYMLNTDALSTTYKQHQGFVNSANYTKLSNAKKSADGRTISWYSTGGEEYQYNDIGYRYYYIAIG